MSVQPESADPAALRYRWKAAIISAAVFSFVCKVLLAWNTFGTNDDYTWERFSFWSRLLGVGVYRANPDFNHPPSMIYMLRFIGWLADTTGIFFPFWMRLPAILADAGSLWIVWRILASRLHKPSVRWAILLAALSPALILTSGFHGNTDSEMVFLVLLSIWLAETGGAGEWAAGAALGAAMCIKVLPLIVIPVMFLYLSGYRRRLIFLASLAATVILLSSPYMFEDPRYIFHQVFEYRSLYGVWGLSWLLQLGANHSPKWQGLNRLFQSRGSYLLLAAIVALSFWIGRPIPTNHRIKLTDAKPALFSQVGALLFLFLAATNGFGVQYLAWLVPWTAGVEVAPAAIFFGASGIYLFLVYDYWAGGMPWYLADANYQRESHGQLDYPGVVCWLSVVLLVWSAWRQLKGGAAEKTVRVSAAPAFCARTLRAPALRVVLACLLAVPVLVFPMARQLFIDSRRTTFGDSATVTTVRAAEYVDLALRLESVGKNWGTVGSAGRALALHPDLRSATVDIPTSPLADFWNILAESYAQRGMWDESIAAAGESLRVHPNAAAHANIARRWNRKDCTAVGRSDPIA